MATKQSDVMTSVHPNLLGARSAVHPTGFSRLRSLFPTHAPETKVIELPTSPGQRSSIAKPRLLKVHIISWNMHDSFPKGNLEELLGRVPPYRSQATSSDTFPIFPADDTHPYHILVVAGQECPTTSGIPMGLSAGWKLYDKGREKDQGKERERDKTQVENVIPERSEPQTNLKRRKSNNDLSYSWTAMVEDWLCKGKRRAFRNGLPANTDVGSPKPLPPLISPKESKQGPYQLLVKERMMGIYMAIYVHKDFRQTIQGCSKSAVTAGLIGGRVGNKGGVGISLNILGTTFLFINAHLAAQGNKMNLRLANLAKIKAELTVDPFLPDDDPRVMAEDLTDKFDFTFIFGDLNFRLDITRLHADWLISRKDYTQALYFDQLKMMMNGGQAFVGFNEGPIDFPPTFKYDVLRTLKMDKSLASRHSYSLKSTSSNSLSISVDGQGNISNSILSAPLTQTIALDGSQASLALSAGRRKRKKWLSFILYNRSSRSIPRPDDPVGNKLYLDSLTSASGPIPTSIASNTSTIPMASTLTTKQTPEEEMEMIDRGIYDSSHKRRVPSWCDRILWKSTLKPDPVDEPLDINSPSGSRFMQTFANAFRPFSMRPRSASHGATLSGWTKGNVTVPEASTFETPSFTKEFHTIPIFKTAQSHDSLQTNKIVVTAPESQLHRRRANPVTIPPIATVPKEQPTRRATDSSAAYRSPSRSDFWRFLPSFLSPSQSGDTIASPTTSSSASQPRKGDVICLSYRTLDDREMCRLEGRSDHRPVIGTYAVYF